MATRTTISFIDALLGAQGGQEEFNLLHLLPDPQPPEQPRLGVLPDRGTKPLWLSSTLLDRLNLALQKDEDLTELREEFLNKLGEYHTALEVRGREVLRAVDAQGE